MDWSDSTGPWHGPIILLRSYRHGRQRYYSLRRSVARAHFSCRCRATPCTKSLQFSDFGARSGRLLARRELLAIGAGRHAEMTFEGAPEGVVARIADGDRD